jgi:hypothetical protein
MLTVFDNSDGKGDQPYLVWLTEHPRGLVLQSRRHHDPAYLVLHRSSCWTISRATSTMRADPFTGQSYIKVCSDTEADLRRWLRAERMVDFSKRCAVCNA